MAIGFFSAQDNGRGAEEGPSTLVSCSLRELGVDLSLFSWNGTAARC